MPWVDDLTLEAVVDNSSCVNANDDNDGNAPRVSLISWNVLAEAYCSRRSQCSLPQSYQSHVFDKTKRRHLIIKVLQKFAQDEKVDVVCLQEVDLDEIGRKMHQMGYEGVETPRTKGGCGAGGRTDACSIYVRSEHWSLVQHELIRLDDLATLSSLSSSSSSLPSTSSSSPNGDDAAKNSDMTVPKSKSSGSGNLQGFQHSFLRRNAGLLIRLQHRESGRTVVVANAHLYWHPGFEYVKVQRLSAFPWTSFGYTLMARVADWSLIFLSRHSYAKRTTFFSVPRLFLVPTNP
jgi:mRNA deadenylase 3'-5' endonuclease subunit Ccr4